ncbi:hypothetical protein HXY33_02305 [Candidatus Bathyarchaeota archaeon]|nr:hypothetical protein [Candidatus Bathyarchaeota archaeon]
MLEILMLSSWTCFATYAIWYSTSAKHYAPITTYDARILWKIHRQSTQCASRKWRAIKRGNKIIGFECECGFKHIQKRPIIANAPSTRIKSQKPETLTINKLNTTYKAK